MEKPDESIRRWSQVKERLKAAWQWIRVRPRLMLSLVIKVVVYICDNLPLYLPRFYKELH